MTKDTKKDTKEAPEEVLRKKLGEILEHEDIGISVVIFTHKDCKEPQVWRKGHWYDAAALMNEVLNMYRARAVSDLDLR